MPTRRALLKRFLVWSIVATLLLASYTAGEPILTGLAICRCQSATPVLSAVSAPLRAYRRRTLPGADALTSYSIRGMKKSILWFAPDDLGVQVITFDAPSTEVPATDSGIQ